MTDEKETSNPAVHGPWQYQRCAAPRLPFPHTGNSRPTDAVLAPLTTWHAPITRGLHDV
jgi:hypothetical protein